MLGYIRRHWEGGFRLWFSFWVNGVALGLVVEIVQLALTLRLDPDDTGPAHAGLGVFLMASDLLLITWQNVGIWRSAGRAIAARQGVVGAWLAIVSAALALVWEFGDAAINGPGLLVQLGRVLVP